jgi:hypothetical protein
LDFISAIIQEELNGEHLDSGWQCGFKELKENLWVDLGTDLLGGTGSWSAHKE